MRKVIFCAFGNGLSCAAAALSLENTFISEVREL